MPICIVHHADDGAAGDLAARLKPQLQLDLDPRVFIHKDAPFGTNHVEFMSEKIRGSDVFLLLVNQDTLKDLKSRKSLTFQPVKIAAAKLVLRTQKGSSSQNNQRSDFIFIPIVLEDNLDLAPLFRRFPELVGIKHLEYREDLGIDWLVDKMY